MFVVFGIFSLYVLYSASTCLVTSLYPVQMSADSIQVNSSWNGMAHGAAQEGKWRGNWRMVWVANTLHTTSERGVSSITTADAYTSAASSRMNWRPRRFKLSRPFRRKTKYGFCVCAITFQLASTQKKILVSWSIRAIWWNYFWRCDTYAWNNGKILTGGRKPTYCELSPSKCILVYLKSHRDVCSIYAGLLLWAATKYMPKEWRSILTRRKLLWSKNFKPVP